MKKNILLAGALLLMVTLQAQFSQDYLRAADNYFKKGDYYSAAQYYEKYLGVKPGKSGEGYRPYVVQASSKKKTASGSSRDQAIYNTAESYRQLNYHLRAEPYYQQATALDKERFPLAQYWFATTERALGKYDVAEKAFRDFLASYSGNDQYTKAATREIANLQFIQKELSKKDLAHYTVMQLADGAVDTGSLYAPVWLDATRMLVTATRAEPGEKEFRNKLYELQNEGGSWGLKSLELSQPGKDHYAAASLANSGNVMFFTRWQMDNGKKIAQLYSSNKTGEGWSNPQPVASVNASGYNVQQPFVTADGKYLFYASDKPGGKGGLDIWYAELDASGRPLQSVNAGNAINTEFDEQAPYHHAASGNLIFSTNGRIGMGGLDLFYSKGTINNWTEPVNFGYPVNSIKDDLYFVSRGSAKNILEDVVLSSDRDAACCLQLFSLSKQIPLKQVKGLVVSCDTKLPLQNAAVTIVDDANKTIFNQTTDAAGSYSITLDAYQPLTAMATLPGYHPGSLQFNTPGDPDALLLNNPAICLNKIPEVGEVVVLENVYFEFNKATVLDESHASLDRLVATMNQNPNMMIEISGHTDNKGNDAYNQRLSEARAQSVVDYIISKGIERDRLVAKGYGESQPLAPNEHPDGKDNPEGREKNRRTEFKVLKN